MSEKRQVAKNLIVVITTLILRILVGLWLVPYLVSHLGTAGYGFIPVAAVVNEYMSIIISSLDGAISRFLTIHIQREEYAAANKIVSTSLFGLAALLLAQTPIYYIVVSNAAHIFTVPPELLTDLYWLLSFTIMSFAFSVFTDILAVPLFALNRLDILRMLASLRYLSRVLFIVILFVIDTPNLYNVGLAGFLSSVLSGIVTVYFQRRIAPWLRVNIFDFDKSRLRELLTMSSWIILGYVGLLLFLKSDTPIVNKFIGASEAGEFAAVRQWGMMLENLVSALSGLVAPLILAAYAKNNYRKLEDLVIRSMKILGVFTALVSGLLIAQAEPLLRIWVGNGIEKLYPLFILSLIYLPINLSVKPVNSLWPALNKVKIPGIVSIVAGVLTIVSSIAVIKFTPLKMYGVILVIILITTLRNTVFMPIYASKILKISPRTFFMPLLRICLATIVVVALGLVPSMVFGMIANNWTGLIVSGAVMGTISLPILWRLILTREDREFALSLVPKKIKSRIPFLKGNPR